MPQQPRKLTDTAPDMERLLVCAEDAAIYFRVSDIHLQTFRVRMRDGVYLATDVYLPPKCPAPTVVVRTPYGRNIPKLVKPLMTIAQHGYCVVSQDCRGTGESEPDSWDYYIYEPEDGWDLVEWITAQDWFDGFLGACGSSYLAQTQWCMALHPRMSSIAPEVGGLGIAVRTARLYMFLNAYARSVGKGANKEPLAYDEMERRMLEETLAGGYFNEPLSIAFSEGLLQAYSVLRTLPLLEARQWLWETYASLPPQGRAALLKKALNTNQITAPDIESLSSVFGHRISHDAHTIPHPQPAELCASLHAPALMITGWYDWGLDDALATWNLLVQSAREPVQSKSRLLITPSAHNTPGYHEGKETHPELERTYRTADIVPILMHWYSSVRKNNLAEWPRVIYYLMGANEWYATSAWPPPETQMTDLYLNADGLLTLDPPGQGSIPDRYTYDPLQPTPTLGGSILSYVYSPGSIDVSEVQQRSDVLTYTTPSLTESLDIVGPVRLIFYASTSAVDTDFSARLSDVFPDGRAIQLQSGMLRTRYRNLHSEPELLEPGHIYRFEIDLWATANRFATGHRLRIDISSADFPRFDRNTNRGGEPGPPLPAVQTLYHDPERPSRLLLPILGNPSRAWADDS